jgi:hypothetical protein
MAPRSDVPFLERIDDVDEFLTRQGYVQTDSNEQAFSVLKSLEWHPRVNILTELFYAEGPAILAYVGDPARSLTANEKMTFDPSHWDESLRNYKKWETAWWRECVQNARDARGPERPEGPSEIKLECVVEPYTDRDGKTVEAVRCTCEDNGIGMPEDILRRAFLTWSGSVKPPGAQGGFGDAKELIIMPWLGFEIRTRDSVATGRHDDFSVVKGPYLQGTRVTAWMPRDKATTAEHAQGLVERCNMPNIRFTLNGKRIEAKLAGGDLVRSGTVRRDDGTEVGRYEIYHSSRSRRHGVYIRANGLYMFEKWVGSPYKGVVYVELFGGPKDLFDRKRSGLSEDTNISYAIDAFIADLIRDPRKALKKERADKGKVRKLYEGTGALKVREGIAAEVAAKMSVANPVSDQKKWADGGVNFTEDAIKRIVEAIEEEEPAPEPPPRARDETPIDYEPPPPPPPPPPPLVRTNAQAVGVMLQETKFVGSDHAASALRLMAWQPVFLLVNEVDYYTVPAKLRPEGMSPTYLKLAELWTEVCRFVLLRLGWTRPFGVGFVFEWDDAKNGVTVAAYTREDGLDFLLANPATLAKMGERLDKEGDVISVNFEETQRWDLSDNKAFHQLCAAAVHEVTHMISGLDDADPAFGSELTVNFGALPDLFPVCKKIRAKVLSREASRVRAERVEKATAKPSERDPWEVIVGRLALAIWATGKKWDTMEKINAGRFRDAIEFMDRARLRGTPAEVESLRADAEMAMQGGAFMRTPYEMRPAKALAFYDALVATGLPLASEEVARGVGPVFFKKVPRDPRQKLEAPRGVYTWVETGKERGRPVYALRVGYAGQRGEALTKTTLYASELPELTHLSQFVHDYEASHGGRLTVDDRIIFYPRGKGFRVANSTAFMEPEADGRVNLYSYGDNRFRGGTYATMADAQAHVVEGIKGGAAAT